MQMSTAHADSGSVRKICIDKMCAVREPYSPKGVPFLFANLDSQGFERAERVGHQTLSTTFVYGRFVCLNYHAFDTLLAQSDCCGQAGRTTANYNNIFEICSYGLAHDSSDFRSLSDVLRSTGPRFRGKPPGVQD
jgi:hypothetical protein